MLIRNTIRLGLIGVLLYQLATIPRDFTAAVLLKKSSIVMFVLICVASSKFNAWYMGMVLPLALLLDPKYWLRRLVVLISAAQLGSVTFLKQAYMLNFFVMMLVPAWIVLRKRRNGGNENVSRADGKSIG
jgi:hypothetical protein